MSLLYYIIYLSLFDHLQVSKMLGFKLIFGFLRINLLQNNFIEPPSGVGRHASTPGKQIKKVPVYKLKVDVMIFFNFYFFVYAIFTTLKFIIKMQNINLKKFAVLALKLANSCFMDKIVVQSEIGFT